MVVFIVDKVEYFWRIILNSGTGLPNFGTKSLYRQGYANRWRATDKPSTITDSSLVANEHYWDPKDFSKQGKISLSISKFSLTFGWVQAIKIKFSSGKIGFSDIFASYRRTNSSWFISPLRKTRLLKRGHFFFKTILLNIDRAGRARVLKKFAFLIYLVLN